MSDFKYETMNDLWGEPQEFKGVLFYPILVEDIDWYEKALSVFAIPKKHFKEPKILKSSYLKFLLNILPNTEDEQKIAAAMISAVLKKITKRQSIKLDCRNIGKNPRPTLDEVYYILYIDDIKFSEQDFDIIRDIVLRQCNSSVNFVEQYDPELEKLLTSGEQKTLSMMDRIILFSCLKGVSNMQDIKSMTVFRFLREFEMLQSIESTRTYQPLLLSGQVSIKGKKFKTYNEPVDRESRYSSILLKKEEFVNHSDIMQAARK